MPKTTKEFLAELGNRVSIDDPSDSVVFSNNVSFANGAKLALPANVGIIANGTLGTAGQVLTTNGSAAYWAAGGGGGGSVNTDAQYAWTNTHIFTGTANVNIVATGTNQQSLLRMNSSNGSAFSMISARFNGVPDANNYGAFVTQVDRTFALYSSNANGAPRPIWAVRTNADATVPPDFEGNNTVTDKLGNGLFIDSPVVLRQGIVPYGSGSKGSNGQILASTGNTFPGVKWIDAGGLSVNADAQYTWTNVHTFNANLKITTTSAANSGGIIIAGNAFAINCVTTINQFQIELANSTNKSVLSSFGLQANLIYTTKISGSSAGTVDTDDLTITAANNITVNNNLVIKKGLNANGTLGTAGQILTSNGSSVYWSGMKYNTVQVSAGGVPSSYTITSADSGKMIRTGDGTSVVTNIIFPKNALKEGEFVSIMCCTNGGTKLQLSNGALFEIAGVGGYDLTTLSMKVTAIVTILSKDDGNLYTVVDGFTNIIELSSLFSVKGRPSTLTGTGITNNWRNWPTTDLINIGNYFNATTGLFTAPVAGFYKFTASDYGKAYRNLYIFNNSGGFISTYGPVGSEPGSAVVSGVLFCQKGDTVGLCYGEINGAIDPASGVYWMFSGEWLNRR